jgi:small-conductance mechanosensitive channel
MIYMRKGFTVALMATVLFGGGYFYYIAQAVCPTPLAYSLGDIDERFDISRDEARLIISEAESVWEDATGRNLFSYEEDGKLVINFQYDNRQKLVTSEGALKDELDATENMSEEVKNTHQTLVTEYDKLKATYTKKVSVYEKNLQAYNGEVEKYNKEGGAPEDVYASLSEQKEKLDAEQKSINELSNSLNTLVKEINAIGEKGNTLIKNYNQGVGVYNKTFGEPREFTQGDYSNSTIKIYTFEDREQLKLVLVHEFGHALSLDHVEGEQSSLYYLIGKQPKTVALSEQDLEEFNRVCGEHTLWQKIEVLVGST